ncbi:outer membrane biosynthesis protein TonB [Flavobacterium sp. W4I14]|nr:outer membrane biosynthesis protein TonB [Flavobacterium sp. W4I14]
MIRFAVIFCLAIAPLSGVLAMQQDSTAFTVSNQQEELIKKQDKEKKDKQPENQKPEPLQIKEVPKAKRQVKPMAVKPNVKVKPIKIIKPKIKRP